MRISDWSSDVCSSDLVQSSSQLHQPASQLRSCLLRQHDIACRPCAQQRTWPISSFFNAYAQNKWPGQMPPRGKPVRYWIASGLSTRSEEHTSELQSLMRISYAVFCLQQNTPTTTHPPTTHPTP